MSTDMKKVKKWKINVIENKYLTLGHMVNIRMFQYEIDQNLKKVQMT